MIDRWLHKRRSKSYDCAAFAAEVLNVPVSCLQGTLCARSGWQAVRVPTDGALALLRPLIGPPHVGIYIKGGVLHLGPRVALFQPLTVIKRDYQKIRFYDRRNRNN